LLFNKYFILQHTCTYLSLLVDNQNKLWEFLWTFQKLFECFILNQLKKWVSPKYSFGNGIRWSWSQPSLCTKVTQVRPFFIFVGFFYMQIFCTFDNHFIGGHIDYAGSASWGNLRPILYGFEFKLFSRLCIRDLRFLGEDVQFLRFGFLNDLFQKVRSF